MGLKGAVLWIFDSKMGNKCTIMKRCSNGIKRGSALDFRQQDGQQMYNNEKMFDFLYFSEE